MNLLNKLTINNLKLNKKRTIVTIVGIWLSAALITAVACIYNSGIQSLVNYELRENGAFHIVLYQVPVTSAGNLANNRSVETIYLTEEIGYARIDSRNEEKPYVCIQGFTDGSLDNLGVNLVEGRFPENENEILIPTHLRTSGRVTLNVGDTITLDVGRRVSEDGQELTQNDPLHVTYTAGGKEAAAESITDTTSRTYEIVGITERPSRYIEPYEAPGYTLITHADENSLKGTADVYLRFTKKGINNIYKTAAALLNMDGELLAKYYTDASASEEEILQYLTLAAAANYHFEFNEYLIMLENDPMSVGGVTTLSYAVYVVIAIILLTSIFCIKNSFDISIAEKIRQYGMLRSIGATKKQIRRNVFFEAAILGAFGIPLGILLGFLGSFLLTLVSNYFIADIFSGDRFTLSFVFSWRAAAAALLLGIVTVCFSALQSALKASRVTPLDSIRNSAQISINARKLKTPNAIRKIFGMGGEISWKNLKRNKKKYRTTVISIVVSVTVFIALSEFMSLAFGITDRETERTEYNLSLNTAYETAEEYRKLAGTIHFDHVQEACVCRDAGMEFQGHHYSSAYTDFIGLDPAQDGTGFITVSSIDNEQFAKYCRSLGLDPEDMKDKAILYDYEIISVDDVNKYLRIFDFEKGDIIEGTTENALTGSRITSRIEIGAVSETKPFGYRNWGSSYLFVNEDYFDSIAETRWVQIVYKSDNTNKLQEELEALLKDAEYYGISNVDENYRQMNNLFTLVGIFLYGFIIVISLIGITNIFNTITTNMQLRRPEFAMLRSVGMTNNEFRRMIRLESLFMGVKALIIGIPAGLVLSYLLYHFMAEETGMPFRVPVTALGIAVLAVFALIFLIMTYSMGKIKKQNTIETIRNENI